MATHIDHEGQVTVIFASTVPLSTAVVYSNPVDIERDQYFGLWMYGTPASALSAAQVCIWYEESPDNSNYVKVGSILTNFNGLSGVMSAVSISPVPMTWMKIGLSATSAGVTSGALVSAKLFTQ